MEKKTGVESVIRDIKRNTSMRYNDEEKIRIVLKEETILLKWQIKAN
jgi:hypothetical protein